MSKHNRDRSLVTGGGGFLGLSLCRKLRESGNKIVFLNHQSSVDVTDWRQVFQVEPCDVVYHLAAVPGVDVALERPRETYTTNILGTLHILEYCRIHKAKRVVFASSYIYGPPKYLPVDEEHPTNPSNPYAQSKAIGETLCRQYHEDFGISIVILRIFNPYGPRQRGSFLIPTILEQIQKEERVVLRDPAPKRDFVFVEDVADAFIKAGTYSGSGFAIFNVASGKSYSVAEVVDRIRSNVGRSFDVTYTGPSRPFEIADCFGSVGHSKLTLGWEAKIDLDRGIRETIKAWDW